jgi:hypothetical protein
MDPGSGRPKNRVPQHWSKWRKADLKTRWQAYADTAAKNEVMIKKYGTTILF